MGKTLNTKQNMYLIIGIFLISLLVLGGTYAWLQDFAVTNNSIASNTTCFNIVYDKGGDITGTLFPSSSPSGGLKGEISIGMRGLCDISAIANIYLSITESGNVLFQTVDAHCENSKTLKTMRNYTTQSTCEAQTNGKWVTNGTALKYAVYNSSDTTINDPVSVGYLSVLGTKKMYNNFIIEKPEDDDPDDDAPPADTVVDYEIYVWLDGYLSDNTYQNQSFRATVSADASQVNG